MRVISLVPSLTLTLADLGLDASQLVGRTPWCIHPESFVEGCEGDGWYEDTEHQQTSRCTT